MAEKNRNPHPIASRLGIPGPVLGALAVAVGLFAACARSPVAMETVDAGFLGEYSQFERPDASSRLHIHVPPGGDLRRYKKVLLDPVSIYASKDPELGWLDEKDLELLTSELASALQRQLGIDYVLVLTEGPDVLRIRAALTRTQDKQAGIRTFRESPSERPRAGGRRTPSAQALQFLASSRAEFEVSDARSGERVVALVDDTPLRNPEATGAPSHAAIQVDCQRRAETLRLQLQRIRDGKPEPPRDPRELRGPAQAGGATLQKPTGKGPES